MESANQGVKGSYSGILPSLNLSTSGGKTKYPTQESIIPDLVNLEIDTIKSGESSYMSAGLSINQTLYNGGRSFNMVKQAKINLEIAQNLEFEEGDCAVTIKKDGSIGKVIVPKMNTEMLNSEGYKALLEVVEVLQPGSKEEFIKHNESEKGSVH